MLHGDSVWWKNSRDTKKMLRSDAVALVSWSVPSDSPNGRSVPCNGGARRPMVAFGDVVCNGCVACCRRENVLVSLQFGDDPGQFAIDREVRPGVFAVAAQPNGDCHYLDPKAGCTIYERRPAMCRSFDCRLEASRPTEERRELVQRGLVAADVMRAGRERFLKLSPPAQAALRHNYQKRARPS